MSMTQVQEFRPTQCIHSAYIILVTVHTVYHMSMAHMLLYKGCSTHVHGTGIEIPAHLVNTQRIYQSSWHIRYGTKTCLDTQTVHLLGSWHTCYSIEAILYTHNICRY